MMAYAKVYSKMLHAYSNVYSNMLHAYYHGSTFHTETI